MTIRMLWAPAALSLLVLSGCSSTPASPQVTQLHQEVSQLNQQMRQLTNQAGALEIQGQLNGQSSQGAWLLPQANTPVELQTQLGKLRLSLTNVEGEATGSRAILTIRSTDGKPVPALNATVVWGEMDPASGKPLNAGSLSQTISAPGSLTPRSAVVVPLRLSGLSPDQLGYVRVHDVTAATTP
jgi:outer membrane murein-binding lipoprotein Lpp